MECGIDWKPLLTSSSLSLSSNIPSSLYIFLTVLNNIISHRRKKKKKTVAGPTCSLFMLDGVATLDPRPHNSTI